MGASRGRDTPVDPVGWSNRPHVGLLTKTMKTGPTIHIACQHQHGKEGIKGDPLKSTLHLVEGHEK